MNNKLQRIINFVNNYKFNGENKLYVQDDHSESNYYMVVTYDGYDGGDIFPDGRYEYDFNKYIDLDKQTEQEATKILDDYFND